MRKFMALSIFTGVLLLLCVGQATAVIVPKTGGDSPVLATTDGTTTTTISTAFSTIPTETATNADNDTLSNDREVNIFNTNPSKADTDSDGLDDGEEVNQYLTNPTEPDTDNDGLTDRREVEQLGTDPSRMDTDKDGITDGDEVSAGTDPISETSVPNDKTNRPTIGNESAVGGDETGLLGAATRYKLPILTFTGGLVIAFGLMKGVRLYQSYHRHVIVELEDD
jgi:hypothetical protein